MKPSAVPRLVALLGLLSLAFSPAAAQPRAHGFGAGPSRAPPRAAYTAAFAGQRGDYQQPHYPSGPYGPGSAAPPYFPRTYAPPPYLGPTGPYASPQPGRLGGGFRGNWRAEQDEVRRAVRDGRHVPLSQAIAAVRQRSPGHVLDAGVEGGADGRSLYRLRWATNDGRRIDYLVDAATGAVVGVQGGH